MHVHGRGSHGRRGHARRGLSARAAQAAIALSLTAAGATPIGVPLAAAALAATAKPTGQSPRAATGGVTHVRGTSAVLQGSVDPRGLATTYYFQYGPTIAYGSQTAPASVGAGTSTVKVGQSVAAFSPGDHYRIVATNSAGTKLGPDRVYAIGKGKLKFMMASNNGVAPTPYGGTYTLRGTLTGAGGALKPISLQSSPFPFLTAFTDLGTPTVTNAAGTFAIPVKGLTKSVQLRVTTGDARPLLSPAVTVHVSPRVTLKVRTSAHRGLVRLYGTVTPAEVGARVLIQLEKPTRPHGKSEREARFATQASTVAKRATRSFSRFSQVVTIAKGGHYRAYVVLRTGALVSGASPTVTLHAAASTKKRR